MRWSTSSPARSSRIPAEGKIDLDHARVTKNGAIASKMLDELGTLDVGKYADVVMLDANPLEDISSIRAINTVIRDGKFVDLDALPYERIFSKAGKGHAW